MNMSYNLLLGGNILCLDKEILNSWKYCVCSSTTIFTNAMILNFLDRTILEFDRIEKRRKNRFYRFIDDSIFFIKTKIGLEIY